MKKQILLARLHWKFNFAFIVFYNLAATHLRNWWYHQVIRFPKCNTLTHLLLVSCCISGDLEKFSSWFRIRTTSCGRWLTLRSWTCAGDDDEYLESVSGDAAADWCRNSIGGFFSTTKESGSSWMWFTNCGT